MLSFLKYLGFILGKIEDKVQAISNAYARQPPSAISKSFQNP